MTGTEDISVEEGGYQMPTEMWGGVLANSRELNQYSQVPDTAEESPVIYRPRSRWIEVRNCCNLSLLLLAVILTCIAVKYLASISMNTMISAVSMERASLNVSSDFIKTAVAFSTEFATLLLSQRNAAIPMLRFPLSSITGEPTLLIFTATYSVGTYGGNNGPSSGSFSALLNLAAEDTDELVFYFQLAEDHRGIHLYQKQTTLRTKDFEMADSLKRSAPDQHVATLPVVEIGKATTSLNKNGAIKQSDEMTVTALAAPLLQNGCFITDITPQTLKEANVVISTARGFPKNLDFTVQYLVAISLNSTLDVSLRFGISKLPDDPMPSRRADYRVGYFTSSFTYLGSLADQVNKQVNHAKSGKGDSKLHIRESAYIDPTVHVIERRRISRDGGGLIYYVDPSVPPKWRHAVKLGVENWQPAFESAMLGSKAIKAVLPGDIDWPSDYDPADIRFNAITWAVDTDRVFAIGPSTVDPRSGEILKSSIVLTNGFIHAYVTMAENFSSLGGKDRRNIKRTMKEENDDPQNSLLNNDPIPKRFRNIYDDMLTSNDENHYDYRRATASSQIPDDVLRVLPSLKVDHHPSQLPSPERKTSYEKGRQSHHYPPHRYNSFRYHYSEDDVGVFENRGLYSGAILEHIISDKVLSQGITSVVMHEVGHTLGLRHNFRGSTAYNLSDLQDPEFTAKYGLTSSVMDYLPPNLVSKRLRGDRSTKPDIFTTCIGVYDKWAIKYGYMPLDGVKSGQNEPLLFLHPSLKEVAAACEPYSTDEDTIALGGGSDPFSTQFDLGNDPLAFYIDQLQLIKEIREDGLLERAVGPTEPFTLYGSFEDVLIRKMKFIGTSIARYVGGFTLRKVSREGGDVSSSRTSGKDQNVVPLQSIDVDLQMKALSAIKRILVHDTDEGLWPDSSSLPYMVKSSGLYCDSLYPYCDGVIPYPFLTAVNNMRKEVLLSLVHPKRLEMLQLQFWGTEGRTTTTSSSSSSNSTAITTKGFGPVHLIQNITAMIWGENLMELGRVKSTR